MKIVFATNNKHKLEEMRQILGSQIQLLSLNDIGCHEDIPETGKTLEENALIKARYVKQHYGYDCFADDTGLEVDALGGEPGVYSARYAQVRGGEGSGHDAAANTALLLRQLDGVQDRHARFRTVIALILGNEEVMMDGIVEGEIIAEPAGVGGFGYDPVFKPVGWSHTFAEASPEQKNAVSHRGRAAMKLKKYFEEKHMI